MFPTDDSAWVRNPVEHPILPNTAYDPNIRGERFLGVFDGYRDVLNVIGGEDMLIGDVFQMRDPLRGTGTSNHILVGCNGTYYWREYRPNEGEALDSVGHYVRYVFTHNRWIRHTQADMAREHAYSLSPAGQAGQ